MIMKTLTEVRRYLKTINYINAGGCGIAALAMYMWLKKNQPKKLYNLKIVYLYTNSRDYMYNQTNLKYNNKNNMHVPSHICLLINKKYIDVNNKISTHMYRHIQIIDVPKGATYLLNIINNPNSNNGWNYAFNRKNVSCIEKILSINLRRLRGKL